MYGCDPRRPATGPAATEPVTLAHPGVDSHEDQDDLAALFAAGLAASTARAQDTGARLSGGDAATRSPSTTPIDAPPATNRGVVGNERPGGTASPAASSPGLREAWRHRCLGWSGALGAPGGLGRMNSTGGMIGRPGGGFMLSPNATFDQIFAAAATTGGLSEVAMARIAMQRGSSDEVRLFAQRMIADHSRANNELVNLATSRAMPLPMSLEVRDRADEAILMGKSGEDFDKAYIHQQLAAHMCAVALFEAESMRGQDPQLRAWAARMLPTLQDHKRQAKRMHEDYEARVKGKSAADPR